MYNTLDLPLEKHQGLLKAIVLIGILLSYLIYAYITYCIEHECHNEDYLDDEDFK